MFTKLISLACAQVSCKERQRDGKRTWRVLQKIKTKVEAPFDWEWGGRGSFWGRGWKE